MSKNKDAEIEQLKEEITSIVMGYDKTIEYSNLQAERIKALEAENQRLKEVLRDAYYRLERGEAILSGGLIETQLKRILKESEG